MQYKIYKYYIKDRRRWLVRIRFIHNGLCMNRIFHSETDVEEYIQWCKKEYDDKVECDNKNEFEIMFN